ncbi:secreted trypsin-like serine protease [Bradyrhizobium sp. AZCC 1678]|uniref:serine protease n=1 Tax=Bradyrhizobium sp. AZCC 1678 TaxID=3117030 RepID=UPI002FEF06A1
MKPDMISLRGRASIACALGALALVCGTMLLTPAYSDELAADQLQGSAPYIETARRYLQSAEQKIIGGHPVLPGTHKWQSSLQISWVPSGVDAHFCGGSLIAPDWILTAGHCMEDLKSTDVRAVVGTSDLGKSAQARSVRRIIVHAKYATDKSNLVAGPHPVNDVALVQVFKPFEMNAQLQQISLIDTALEATIAQPNQEMTASGFGATKVGGKPVAGLLSVDVPFVSRETCNRPQSYDHAITDGMICAGEVNKDSCQGDSGGPLTYHPLKDDVVQIGIVGWGDKCGVQNKYGVYTRVSAYRDWIAACMSSPNDLAKCPRK